MAYPRLQCLTIDHPALSHTEQVRQLCAAGAGWIQLRIKNASTEMIETVARDARTLCREHQCRLIINDHLDLALKIGADGVHLGSEDIPWADARTKAGSNFIIGGTVNSLEDAQAAVQSDCLDYVGVGPFRFTPTKQRLAPVLSIEQWKAILNTLGDLPAYAIGGITAADLPENLPRGIFGIAVSSALYASKDVQGNFKHLAALWNQSPSKTPDRKETL